MTETPELLPALTPPPETLGEESPVSEDQDEFDQRVNRILGMIAADPDVRDRVLVELYVTIAEFKEAFDEMQDSVSKMGPRAFFKGMFGRDKGEE